LRRRKELPVARAQAPALPARIDQPELALELELGEVHDLARPRAATPPAGNGRAMAPGARADPVVAEKMCRHGCLLPGFASFVSTATERTAAMAVTLGQRENERIACALQR